MYYQNGLAFWSC